MSKIIGFIGSCPADICMYAAYAMQNTGSSVCVIDNSMEGVLYGCVPKMDAQAMAVTFHQVDFIRFKPFIYWHELEYTYVFILLGDRPQQLCMASCSMCVLVVDCERRNLDFYRRFMKESSMAMYVVLRGFCAGSVFVEKIMERFSDQNGLIVRWMLVPLDETDEAYRIGMQYEKIGKFPDISLAMEKVLAQILALLGAGSPVGVMQAVKNAEKGKNSAYRILG